MPNRTLDFTRIEHRLKRIYGERASEALPLITSCLEDFASRGVQFGNAPDSKWDQQDVVLITYGDQVRPDSDVTTESPLQCLLSFLRDHELQDKINTVHFLPCFPYSSDDGFSVIDYRQIDPNLGTWKDIEAFTHYGHLMFDFVVNHISQESEWFRQYLAGESPYDSFFIEADPSQDLSEVTRPRSLPLLSDFETNRGERWLWTTFSRDQIDLNYSEPRLLTAMIEMLLLYIQQGARIIRLDAIAYLWKQIGTNCIHLPETHEVVKLLRDVVELVAPHVLLLTETNVPHAENVSYFGDGDEAHMVYQFSLPPLLLDAFLNQDAKPLKQWLADLEAPPQGATYFNFTASHDGVGVRPLEGHVTGERLASLVEKVRARGGMIGTKRNSDGSDSPYELNVSYVDALGPVGDELTPRQHADRFLASQAVMMSLQGMPAIYFHSLVGTQNDIAAAESSGIPRRINRRKFSRDDLDRRLQGDSLQRLIFIGMQKLLETRVRQMAFHPDAEQTYHESGSDHVLCFERRSSQPVQHLFVAANFSDQPQPCQVPGQFQGALDLLESGVCATSEVTLQPSQVVWLEADQTSN